MGINMPTWKLSRYLKNVSPGPTFAGLYNVRRSSTEMCVSEWQTSVRITQHGPTAMTPTLEPDQNRRKLETKLKLLPAPSDPD